MTDRAPPDETSLREAALNYLARYATTESGLRLVLRRRIERWAREATDIEDAAGLATAAMAHIPGIVTRMVELGLLNDTVFAETRAKGLALGGRSRRAIATRLMAKGISPDLARTALPEDAADELVSALILARKRRIGPFRLAPEGDANKEMGVMARAGFPRDVAARALEMEPETAEDLVRAARA